MSARRDRLTEVDQSLQENLDRFHVEIRPDQAQVPIAIDALIDYLSSQPQAEQLPAMDVRLVLAEALNNVIEHAMKDREDGQITVELRAAGDGAHIGIQDNGDPLPELRLPCKDMALMTPEDLDTADLPEGGFGWAMICELSASVSYRRSGGLNNLMILIPLS